MSVGFTLLRADIDSRAGSLLMQVRNGLRDCAAFNALLNNTQVVPNDAFLTTTLGYSTTEKDWLRGAFTDMNALNNVSRSAGTVPSNNDFWFNAQHLLGVQL